ncbi:MAG: hypothetical protein ACKO23_08850 [Gemmataceae bacterium]
MRYLAFALLFAVATVIGCAKPTEPSGPPVKTVEVKGGALDKMKGKGAVVGDELPK